MKMNGDELLLDQQEVMDVPQNLLPMVVLSDNLRSFFSFAIKVHEQGAYNHMMWMIRPGVLASQNAVFQEQSASKYLSRYRLKLWCCPSWTDEERKLIVDAIATDISKPWYCRIYDPIAIIGQALGIDDMQIPGADICSDKARYLQLVDKEYDLDHPDPEDVNRWLMGRSKYQVFGRYVPD